LSATPGADPEVRYLRSDDGSVQGQDVWRKLKPNYAAARAGVQDCPRQDGWSQCDWSYRDRTVAAKRRVPYHCLVAFSASVFLRRRILRRCRNWRRARARARGYGRVQHDAVDRLGYWRRAAESGWTVRGIFRLLGARVLLAYNRREYEYAAAQVIKGLSPKMDFEQSYRSKRNGASDRAVSNREGTLPI
jgi:hypothetical protein